MSKLHEMMKDILNDMDKFLRDSLLSVSLPMTVKIDRNSILDKISRIRTEYPQLTAGHRQSQNSSSAEPSSPPPYLDMKGSKRSASTEYIFSDSAEDHYEICEAETSHNTDTSVENCSFSEQEDSLYDASDKDAVAISATEMTNAVKSGYLEKKGKGLFNPYQKRWCAIRDNVLYYYSRPSDKRQCGQILLTGYEARPFIPSSRESSRKDLCFELVCPGKRSYQFAATSMKEVQDWLSAIQKAAIPKNETSTVPARTHFVEDDIYEVVEDHTNDREMVAKDNESRDDIESYKSVANEEQDLYDDADSFLPDVLEAQNRFVEVEVENPECWYVGQWDCGADETNELSFKRGDLIRIVHKKHDGYSWWMGEKDGNTGLVPKNYLTLAYEVISDRSV